MASFFSLGTGTSSTTTTTTGVAIEDNQHQPTTQISPENWFLHRNQESSFKGFELWQQQDQQHSQQQHQIHHQEQGTQDLYTLGGVGLGVGPSWGFVDEAAVDPQRETSTSRSSGYGGGAVMMRAAGGSGGGICCQDCGNQAKKDCPHMRCRTCCKSRGLPCSTHVRSTWVPAAKRRERQQQLAALQQQQERIHGGGGESSNKRLRNENDPAASNSSSLVCTRLTPLASGMEMGVMPSELNSKAVFRCVKVSSTDEGEDHYAYQTAVNICGHVFKGILHDQGPEGTYSTGGGAGGGESSSGTGSMPPSLNLIHAGSIAAASSASGVASTMMASSPMAFLDPSLFQAPLSSFFAPGTQFFPGSRP